MSDNLNIQPEIEKEVNDLPPVDSKDSPDFLLSEFETSFSRTPGDILATDKHAKDYTLASFEEYKDNEAIQSAFRQSGVEFTEELYDAISKKKEIVSDYTSDIESISDGPVFDTAVNRMLGRSISSNANAFICIFY